MPWRRFSAAVCGDCMKSSSSRTAAGCVDAVHSAAEKVVTICDAGRHLADQIDALQVHQLAALLEAQLDLAARHQRTHRHARRRLHDALAQGLGDAPALEQPQQRHAAGAGGIAHRARRQQRLAQRGFAADVRPRRAGAHRDGHAGMHQVGPAAGHRAARGQQLVDGVGRQHHQIEGLARFDAPRGIDAAHRLEAHSMPLCCR